jgi:excisionase family DNA binding protein
MEKYFSTKEVAEMLSISIKTVLSLINSGRIKATNLAVGSRALYRVTSRDLNKFINSNKYGKRNTDNQEVS